MAKKRQPTKVVVTYEVLVHDETKMRHVLGRYENIPKAMEASCPLTELLPYVLERPRPPLDFGCEIIRVSTTGDDDLLCERCGCQRVLR